MSLFTLNTLICRLITPLVQRLPGSTQNKAAEPPLSVDSRGGLICRADTVPSGLVRCQSKAQEAVFMWRHVAEEHMRGEEQRWTL